MKKIGSNAYVIDLPFDLGISSVVNVEDLFPFQGPTASLDNIAHNKTHEPTRSNSAGYGQASEPNFELDQYPKSPHLYHL